MSISESSTTTPLKRRPRAVDFRRRDDLTVLILAAQGMSTAYIAQETSLSESQVQYRIGAGALNGATHCSRSDYRNGRSPFCRHLLAAAKPIVTAQLIKHLRANVESYQY